MAVNSLTRDTLTNTVKYTSMLAGNDAFDPSSDFLITQTVLSSSAASITFDVSTLAAQGYKHLQLRGVFLSGQANWPSLVLNNDTTTANYRAHTTRGNGTNLQSYDWTGNAGMGAQFLVGTTTPAPAVIDLLDIFSTSKYKTSKTFFGSSESTTTGVSSGFWMSTAATTTITITHPSSTFSVGTRLSLYGSKG